MGKETTSPNEAYATFPKWQPGRKGPWPIPDWSARRRPSASTTPACWARAIRSARTVLARATTTG